MKSITVMEEPMVRKRSPGLQNYVKVYTPLVTPDIKEIQDFLYKQERGDAELLASLFHREFLYDHIAQCWLWYENGVWNQDQEKQTLRIAVEELTRVYLDASSRTDQEITRLMGEKDDANQEKISRLEGLRDRLRGKGQQAQQQEQNH